MTSPKTILFLGATGGVCLAALRRALAANHTCIALCRTPSNLTAQLPENSSSNPNLHIIQGDARDPSVLATCLVHPSDATRLVDTIISSIGARPTLRGMSDPHVCETGMEALLAALRRVREERGVTGNKPRLVAVSSTGISDVARDLPYLMVPLYKVVLHNAHMDKKAMERLVMGSGEYTEWTLVRGSLYTNGPATEGLVRVGMEDPVKGVVERVAIGYTISREDVGKWVFEACIEGGKEWVGKAAIITY
ncbi:oxidoreductase AflX [Parachaetomium inaequale]|uniref:Oxidoreductase AflX n=1 Tax=Parachaetomium inaequale TaxID=2588326 RepID=A0AAN6PEY8_9PEZI|nr:oxidoreductase AflX [Parachaetomium inaequale]